MPRHPRAGASCRTQPNQQPGRTRNGAYQRIVGDPVLGLRSRAYAATFAGRGLSCEIRLMRGSWARVACDRGRAGRAGLVDAVRVRRCRRAGSAGWRPAPGTCEPERSIVALAGGCGAADLDRGHDRFRQDDHGNASRGLAGAPGRKRAGVLRMRRRSPHPDQG